MNTKPHIEDFDINLLMELALALSEAGHATQAVLIKKAVLEIEVLRDELKRLRVLSEPVWPRPES